MRYKPEHKAEVHQKIVKDAARRVRAEGMSGAAVAKVMRDNGLTHGGFYKHFESKDALLVESLGEAFHGIEDRLVAAAHKARPGSEWKAIVKEYLSPAHVEGVEDGCPLTALGPELARAEKPLDSQIFQELARYKDRMQPYMPGTRPIEKERAFFAIFSTMIGAVELARMMPVAKLREKVLASARDLLLRRY